MDERVMPISAIVEDANVLDRGETAKREGIFVFESAWEVANKGKY